MVGWLKQHTMLPDQDNADEHEPDSAQADAKMLATSAWQEIRTLSLTMTAAYGTCMAAHFLGLSP